MTKRWVRFVMPIMVEIDCDEDEVLRVVTLPEEIRQNRDDRGHFLTYDERFVRRHGDDQPQTHASCVAEPYWEHERFRVGALSPEELVVATDAVEQDIPNGEDGSDDDDSD